MHKAWFNVPRRVSAEKYLSGQMPCELTPRIAYKRKYVFNQQYYLFIAHENHRASDQLGIQLFVHRDRYSNGDDDTYSIYHLDDQPVIAFGH